MASERGELNVIKNDNTNQSDKECYENNLKSVNGREKSLLTSGRQEIGNGKSCAVDDRRNMRLRARNVEETWLPAECKPA